METNGSDDAFVLLSLGLKIFVIGFDLFLRQFADIVIVFYHAFKSLFVLECRFVELDFYLIYCLH